MSVRFESYAQARAGFKDLLDAAQRGRVATVRRDSTTAAVVDAERLRYFLARIISAKAQVVSEDGGWSVFIPGLPLAADAGSFEEAITEMIDVLREYSEDWQDHLLDAPNHREQWGLVQMVSLSTDDQLREWLIGEVR